MTRHNFIIIIFFLLCWMIPPAYGQQPEKWYQQAWCLEHNGQIEVVLSDRTRCDCVTGTHAIEFDFAKKWAEAIGQSLNYSRQTGKRAGIVLIVALPKDWKYVERLKGIIKHFELPIDLWMVRK